MAIRPYVALARPFTLLAPVVGTAAAAGAAAAALHRPWATGHLAAALAGALFATAASNAWNQAFDAEIDRENKPHRPIPAGRVSVRGALRAGDALALLGLGAGALASPSFLACLAAGVLGTWIYSAPPLRTKRKTALALLTIAIPRGYLVPVAGWSVVAVPTQADPWALGLVAFLFVLGAAATKDFADAAGDRAHGCETLPVRLGARRAARWIAPFLVLPFLAYPGLGALGWLTPSAGRLWALAGALASLGLVTAYFLLSDPEGLAAGRRGHPAWVGMYLLLVASQVGVLVVYAA